MRTRMDVVLLEELIEYLSGEVEGRMGLRSWLGPMLDGTSTAGGEAGPSDLALVSARATARVERALMQLGSAHIEVLIAAHSPRGPQTPMGCGPHGPDGLQAAFGAASVASIAALLEGRERGESADAGAARLRLFVRARAEAKGDAKRAASQQLAYARTRAKRALEMAHEAYLIVYEAAREGERDERMRRRRQHMEAPC